MTALAIKTHNYLLNLINAFMDSSFMKAWEEAAIRRAQYYISRNTMNELNKLTDKELKDIGIARGDIYDIATKR